MLTNRTSTGAASHPAPRLWILPLVVVSLVGADHYFAGLDSLAVTAAAALAIVLFGIPHGTLDVEIAARRFGLSTVVGKIQIIAGYLFCAVITALCWHVAPGLALALFLLISIIHFGQDWRNGADPFLAMMVGWGLISVPALSHPQIVSDIFTLLTNSRSGETIASLLAIASAPAALGCLVYAFWAFRNNELQDAVEVLSCLAAALLLPPLIAFSVFFCGLHSPRHMAVAMEEAGGIGRVRKIFVIIAVSLLAFGIGALLFFNQTGLAAEGNIVRTAFVLISILTVPHFILEHLTAATARHGAR